jgi:kumamolisin
MSHGHAASPHARVSMSNHERISHPDEMIAGPTDPSLDLQVTLVLRRESGERDLASVLDFCGQHSLAIIGASAERRAVTVSARAELMANAFAVKLIDVERRGKRYRRLNSSPSLPSPLNEVVVGVFGLRARPLRPRVRVHHANTTNPFWTVAELADAYGFPGEANGTGQTIGLIELGGGYHESDLEMFFAELKLPVPKITFISFDGMQNSPASPEAIEKWIEVVEGKRPLQSVEAQVLADAQATVEVTMDLQIVGALAPGAHIVVYMAPMTEQGMFNALSQAVSHEDPLVDVISMSWGEAEPCVSDAYLRAIDDVLADAAQRGITVCASSGDAGSDNDSPDEFPCVNFPASSPHVLACGGSTVRRFDSKTPDEVVWNCGPHGLPAATGGGVSRRFALPDWQRDRGVPLAPADFVGRGVPDVSGPADPHNGCAILVGGFRCSSAGTSAVAPLWAALIARFNELLRTRCGHITPILYRIADPKSNSPLNPVIEGHNGAYKAGPGWNPCTGLGTPRGRQLLECLRMTTTT